MKQEGLEIEWLKDRYYKADVSGLLYLLKHNKLPEGSIVYETMIQSITTTHVGTYEVIESDEGKPLLVSAEDVNDTLLKEFLPTVKENPLTFMKDADFLTELLEEAGMAGNGFDVEIEAFDETDAFIVDEVAMDATYYIFTSDGVDYLADPTTHDKKSVLRFEMIHSEEALHRLSKGEVVFIDKGDATYQPVYQDTALTAQMITKGVWATTQVHKGIKQFLNEPKQSPKASAVSDVPFPEVEESVFSEDALALQLAHFLKESDVEKTRDAHLALDDLIEDIKTEWFLDELKKRFKH